MGITIIIVLGIMKISEKEMRVSSVTQIFEHLRKEVPREDVQRAVYGLYKEGSIDKEGPKAKTVYFLAKKMIEKENEKEDNSTI